MFEDDAGPTVLGDLTLLVCMVIVFAAATGLGWHLFIAIREAVLWAL